MIVCIQERWQIWTQQLLSCEPGQCAPQGNGNNSVRKNNRIFTEAQLSDKQFGFIPGGPRVLQVLHVMDDWTRILAEGCEVDVIYTDFQEASHKAQHQSLSNKSWHAGQHITMDQQFLCWQAAENPYLGSNSSCTYSMSGVPQGSVVEPVLLALFINYSLMKYQGPSSLMCICSRVTLQFKEKFLHSRTR